MEKQKLVLLKTAHVPKSILIGKKKHAEIYPDRYPRVLHIVFRSRTKTAWVEEKLARYLVKTYPEIEYVEEVEKIPATNPNVDLDQNKTEIEKNTQAVAPKKTPPKKRKKPAPKKEIVKNDKVTGSPGTTE